MGGTNDSELDKILGRFADEIEIVIRRGLTGDTSRRLNWDSLEQEIQEYVASQNNKAIQHTLAECEKRRKKNERKTKV